MPVIEINGTNLEYVEKGHGASRQNCLGSLFTWNRGRCLMISWQILEAII